MPSVAAEKLSSCQKRRKEIAFNFDIGHLCRSTERRLDTANAQVTAASQFALRLMPAGILPPEFQIDYRW